jgi:hypothetical protein
MTRAPDGTDGGKALWVVKVGGSLYDAAELRTWLDTLAAVGGGRLVIVPGGGPFAEQVRAAQGRWRFNDNTAHMMALLAMEQYGRMLTAIEPRLCMAAELPAVTAILQVGGVPIWLPVGMASTAGELGSGWDVTADSIAAWFATLIGAGHLGLIKSVMPHPGRHAASKLAVDGLIDARFQQFAGRSPLRVWWLGRGDHVLLRAFLDGARPPAEILAT